MERNRPPKMDRITTIPSAPPSNKGPRIVLYHVTYHRINSPGSSQHGLYIETHPASNENATDNHVSLLLGGESSALTLTPAYLRTKRISKTIQWRVPPSDEKPRKKAGLPTSEKRRDNSSRDPKQTTKQTEKKKTGAGYLLQITGIPVLPYPSPTPPVSEMFAAPPLTPEAKYSSEEDLMPGPLTEEAEEEDECNLAFASNVNNDDRDPCLGLMQVSDDGNANPSLGTRTANDFYSASMLHLRTSSLAQNRSMSMFEHPGPSRSPNQTAPYPPNGDPDASPGLVHPPLRAVSKPKALRRRPYSRTSACSIALPPPISHPIPAITGLRPTPNPSKAIPSKAMLAFAPTHKIRGKPIPRNSFSSMREVGSVPPQTDVDMLCVLAGNVSVVGLGKEDRLAGKFVPTGGPRGLSRPSGGAATWRLDTGFRVAQSKEELRELALLELSMKERDTGKPTRDHAAREVDKSELAMKMAAEEAARSAMAPMDPITDVAGLLEGDGRDWDWRWSGGHAKGLVEAPSFSTAGRGGKGGRGGRGGRGGNRGGDISGESPSRLLDPAVWKWVMDGEEADIEAVEKRWVERVVQYLERVGRVRGFEGLPTTNLEDEEEKARIWMKMNRLRMFDFSRV